MKYKPITFSVRNYREIKSADIRVNGITMLTGPNGCGKASVSKLILDAVAHSAILDDYIGDKVRKRTDNLLVKLECIRSDCKQFLDTSLLQIYERRFASDLYLLPRTDENFDKLMEFIRFLELVLEYKDLNSEAQEHIWAVIAYRAQTTKGEIEGAKDALNEYKCEFLQCLYGQKNIWRLICICGWKVDYRY